MSEKTDAWKQNSPHYKWLLCFRKLCWWRGQARIPLIRQTTTADCAAAAIAMVLAYYGKIVPLREVRERIGSSTAGATAATIIKVAKIFGLRGRGVCLDVDDLAKLPVGSILHWNFKHFVVFEKAQLSSVVIADPASGRRVVPLSAFRKAFTGVALICEPASTFDHTSLSSASAQKRRFLKPLWKQYKTFLKVIGLSFATQSLSLTLPVLTGALIDYVVPSRSYSLLTSLAAGFIAFQSFGLFTSFIRAHLLIYLQAELEANFTLTFLDHMLRLPYSFFQERSSGDLMMRLNSNSSLRSLLTSTVLSAVLDGTMSILYLIMLFAVNAKVGALVLILAVVRLCILSLMRQRQRKLIQENVDNQIISQTSQIELLGGMETLKAMGLEQQMAERWSHLFIEGVNISIRKGRMEAAFGVGLGFIATCSSLVTLFYGTYLVIGERWTLGTMVAFGAVTAGFFGPLNSLVSSLLQVQVAEIYLERLRDVLDTDLEQPQDEAVHIAHRLAGEIEIKQVSFTYDPNAKAILTDLSIRIPSGSRIAVVGRTGCGKSTLARLIAGLYEPIAGSISFDGIDMSKLDRASLRSQLGIVTQDSHLFGGTIRQNIALGNPGMSLAQVMRAAKIACIHEDIVSMPMGYSSLVVDRGRSLSGGQRQRLALARALAIKPRILIMDEATSHLDAVTEAKVLSNLAKIRCTQIVIAHRISTIVACQQIVVLDNGQVVESGSHSELIASEGAYSRLIKASASRELMREAQVVHLADRV